VDVARFGMSRGELRSVIAVLGFDAVFNAAADGAEFVRYLADSAAKEEKLLENQSLLNTPIVRNGKQATVGYCPDIWKNWE
jgi:arsenate reductase-like glutaredoxin family protein